MTDAPLRTRDILELVIDLLSVAGDFLYLVLALLMVLILVRSVTATARFDAQPSHPSVFGADIRRRWGSASTRRRFGMARHAVGRTTGFAPARSARISPPSPGIRRLRARAALVRRNGNWVVARYPY